MDTWWEVSCRSSEIEHPTDIESRLDELGISPDATAAAGAEDDTQSTTANGDEVHTHTVPADSTAEGIDRAASVPPSATVDWEGNGLNWDTTIEITVPDASPLFGRRYAIEFLADDQRVVERRAVAIGMPILLFGATVAVLSGQLGALLGTGDLPLLLTAVGVAATCVGVVIAESGRDLVVHTTESTRTTRSYLGPAFVAAGCLGLAVLLGGVPGILSAAIACAVTGAYLADNGSSSRFAGLSNLLVTARQELPVLAGLYVLYVTIAILSIGFLLLQTASTEVTNAARLGGLWLLTGFITIVLLISIRGRSFSRSNVALAVGATLAMAGVTIINSRVTPAVSAKAPSPVAAVFVAAALLSVWWALWALLANRTRAASRQFSRQGRSVSTRLAGIFAYLSMVLAATLGGSLLAWGWMSWQIIATGRVDLMILAVAVVLPAGYFVAGGLYQVSALLSTIRTFRTETTPVTATDPYHERVATLPFEPVRDVWVLDSEQFFAAAYSDPLDEAIILSKGVFDYFGEQELAAIIAHEESHFEHRGAILQFYLGMLTSFTLLGKNVVYSIYDFYTRELTADETAVTRLATYDHLDGRVGITNVLLAQTRAEVEPAENVPQFLPTLVSMPDAIQPRTVLEETFHLFYGQFAGGVHPSPNERLRNISRDTEQQHE